MQSEEGLGRSVVLVGGVVAFNEESRLPRAIASLLRQELPSGTVWGTIWIVVSGCTDRTLEVARRLAAMHPEVQVLEQAERRGKASALAEVFRVARGDYLVLLNADAGAEEGAISSLLRTAAALEPPFAVMGETIPTELPPTPLSTSIELLWDLHNRLHADLLTLGEGTHLSDELLLLPISALPPLGEGVVNDGAFIGAWLWSHGGRLAFDSGAAVSIEVPWDLSDHVRQRRRIHFGHRQVRQMTGVVPSTIWRVFLRRPAWTLRLLHQVMAARRGGRRALAFIIAAESLSIAGAIWDRLPPREDHRLWRPIRGSADWPMPTGPPAVRTSASPVPSDLLG